MASSIPVPLPEHRSLDLNLALSPSVNSHQRMRGSSMIFTEAEREYLQSQALGRLATVQPDGSPQVNPVGFTYNPTLEAIEISGFRNSRVGFGAEQIGEPHELRPNSR